MDLWIGEDLEEKWRKKKGKNWIRDLKEAGCRILWYTSYRFDGGEKPLLCITDSAQEMRRVKDMGYPCICLETGGYRIYGADLVVENVEDIDFELCKGVYNRHYQIPSVILETERLIVRETVPEDAEQLYQLYEEGNGTYLEPLPGKLQEEQRILSFYFQHIYGFYGYGMWSVIQKEDKRMVGRVGLENGEMDGKGILELGYLIGKAWQRRGYAFEAAKAVIQYAKENMGEEWLYLKAHRENLPSIHLARKLGFDMIKEETLCWFRKRL